MIFVDANIRKCFLIRGYTNSFFLFCCSIDMNILTDKIENQHDRFYCPKGILPVRERRCVNVRARRGVNVRADAASTSGRTRHQRPGGRGINVRADAASTSGAMVCQCQDAG
jgi:hypothetical protein